MHTELIIYFNLPSLSSGNRHFPHVWGMPKLVGFMLELVLENTLVIFIIVGFFAYSPSSL